MKGQRVLVVDDDRDLAEGIADVLELEGHRVTTAFSGEEALSVLAREEFDVAFLDVKLPGIDGVQVLAKLRDRHARLPVIMMTGFRLHQLFAYAVDGKEVPVLRAPFAMSALLEALDRVRAHKGIVIAASHDSGFSDALGLALTDRGYRNLVAGTAREAVAGCGAAALDCLVLDLKRPLLQALEVYQGLDKRGLALPTVVVTEEPLPGSQGTDPLKSLETTGCLFKPFDLDILVELVDRSSFGSIGPHQPGLDLESDAAPGPRSGRAAPIAREAGEDGGQAQDHPAKGQKTILVVEDDDDIRTLVGSFLSSRGYRVLEAANAKMALSRLLGATPPDVLFTDIVLPGGINGIELSEMCRALRPGIAVLFTSGYSPGSNPALRDAQLLPSKAILQKPYRLETLARAIEECCAPGRARMGDRKDST